jgi:hypothetical protein
VTARIDAANKRFAQNATAMSAVAKEMADELERSREAMKRAILDLPEETRQHTAALRKVVADQISALSDLGELVVRYTGSGEIIEPPGRGRPRDGRGQQSRALSERGGPRRAGGTRERWAVPDLLAAASRDDDDEPDGHAGRPGARSQLHVVESLNSISMDIARALDHQAPAELWQRYKSGERKVFTRRLYTMRGQQLFDEISRKYREDPEFRRDVDRYVMDFERLIDQASDDDRDNMLVDTYLTSETGKVYLMLAHAAGRLN